MGPKKILIVEDDEFLRQIYTDTLTSEGYEVHVAKDGEEGLKSIQEGGWDLILLDMMLPKVSGLEILKRIHTEQPKNPNKKIIVASNLDEGQEFQQAKSLSHGYLVKSEVNPGELVAKVKEYLS